MAMNNKPKSFVSQLEETHKEDIEAITQVLVRITSRSPDKIKSHLNAMLEQLVEPEVKPPFYETATPDEWVAALREWSASHDRNKPLLSDYAVSRESMYDDEEL
ncbi:MAG: hypothetical protein KME64_23550 [Scytonematopsis contorta HA4267-MV1]|nr:hypothetical protein [Scytonematopsis contorta HA4267-MV1]